MDQNGGGNLRVATGIIGVSTIIPALAVWCYMRQHHKGKQWLSETGIQRFASNKATVFSLLYVDRLDSGRIGGACTMRCADTGRDVDVKDLVDVPNLTLYSVEVVSGEVLLLFMEVPSVHDLFQLPFLDRGVRKVAKVGSHVYIARLDAVEKIPGLEPIHKRDVEGQRRVSIVWNTGRCGSTLMHRMLQRIGVISFSEPFWLDRVCELKRDGIKVDEVARAFGVCGAVDATLTSRYLDGAPGLPDGPHLFGRGSVSFNVKGKGFKCMDAVVLSLPHARHIFMYRDLRKVVESFCSIFASRPSALEKLLRRLLWWVPSWSRWQEFGPQQMMGGPRLVFSRAMAQARASGAIVEPSLPLAKVICLSWMESMCMWKELNEDGATATHERTRLSIRMDDFVRKDPEVVRRVLGFVVGHRGEVDDAVVSEAMKAFEHNSQKGDRMSTSSFNPASRKPRVLTAQDIEEITAVTRAVPTIGSPDYMHPDSIWATAMSPTSLE